MFAPSKAVLGFISLLLLLAPGISGQTGGGSTVAVNTASGTFTGAVDSRLPIDTFYDIPYAQPPTGNLRLQPPQPILKNFGNLGVSKKTSSQCYGISANPNAHNPLDAFMLQKGTEDCLKLDIIRPHTLDESVLLPVFVFIHGGEFNAGDKSDLSGNNLVATSYANNAPIIYVSINYRLSFLGFPGGLDAQKYNAFNLGLRDQRQALDWISKNIASFGGDPKKVTLGGQATGADSVAYQMMAYGGVDNGLFQAAFLDSGAATGLTPIPKPDYPAWQEHYSNITKYAQCANTYDAFVCLQGLPIDKLTSAFLNTFFDARTIPHHAYAPVVDGSWFQDYPTNLMAEGKFIAVPTLIGHTTDELSDRIAVNLGFDSTEGIIQATGYNVPFCPPQVLDDMLALFEPVNYLNIAPGLLPSSAGSQWSRVVAVDNYLQSFCAVLHAAGQIAAKGKDVFKFRWDALHSTSMKPSYLGVSQGSDLPFLYTNPTLDMTAMTNFELGAIYQNFVLSFINFFNPNVLPIQIDDVTIDNWTTFTANTQNEMLFSINNGRSCVNMEADPTDRQKCDFVEAHHLDFLR